MNKQCDLMTVPELTHRVAMALFTHKGSRLGRAGYCQVCERKLQYSHGVINHADGAIEQIAAHDMSIEQIRRSAPESKRRSLWVLPLMACERAAKASDHPIVDHRLAVLRKERKERLERQRIDEAVTAGESF